MLGGSEAPAEPLERRIQAGEEEKNHHNRLCGRQPQAVKDTDPECVKNSPYGVRTSNIHSDYLRVVEL